MRRVFLGAMLFALLAVAAPAWPCAVPGNLLQNCGFDTDLHAWTFPRGNYTHESADGDSQPGSVTGIAWLSAESAGMSFQQDVHGLLPDTQYGFGVSIRLVKGTASNCLVYVRQYTDAACTVPVPSPPGPAPILIPSASWARIGSGFLTGAEAPGCARFVAGCGSNTSALFGARFDDAFLGEGLVPVELQRFSVE